uniref:ATP synthase complex subunit 8 n=1 Tax=Curculionoidea sp. 12 KM-2017 TaxID=2219395 RepID=A0A346RG14_9CUCU|nr:ATP synthase F0 subunit 8 [Curculionoidea sp. 12 KM-2017]
MPQMSPLSWISLYWFFIIIFIITMILTYYIFTYNPIKKMSLKSPQPKLNWKW